MNGLTTACSATAANPSVINCNVSGVTPAHLDAPASTTGFGGAAFVVAGVTGPSVSN
jgi:hypothetical protein